MKFRKELFRRFMVAHNKVVQKRYNPCLGFNCTGYIFQHDQKYRAINVRIFGYSEYGKEEEGDP